MAPSSYQPRKKLPHDIPLWVRPEACWFITLCTLPRGLNQLATDPTGRAILDAFQQYHATRRWYCHLVLLMPDHLHALLSFPLDDRMAQSLAQLKSYLAKKHPIQWQRDFFDHRLRDEESLHAKANYILENPLRANLVSATTRWPWQWRPDPQ